MCSIVFKCFLTCFISAAAACCCCCFCWCTSRTGFLLFEALLGAFRSFKSDHFFVCRGYCSPFFSVAFAFILLLLSTDLPVYLSVVAPAPVLFLCLPHATEDSAGLDADGMAETPSGWSGRNRFLPILADLAFLRIKEIKSKIIIHPFTILY